MTDNLNDLLFAHIEHMKVKNYSPSTVKNYSREIQKFLDHLRANNITDIRRVTRVTLKTWQAGLMELKAKGEKGHTIATISVKIRAVKRFFEYLESSNHILINPAEHIKEPKKETRLPGAVLTKDEARKILDQPNLSTMTGIRDRTILEVFYSAGIRIGEMRKLTIFDCDLQGGLLRVNKGKFAKDRVIPLGKHAVRFLKEYIARVRPRLTKNNKKTRNLFISQIGSHISRQTIETMVRNCAAQAGIKKKVTPHTFRHTFATELIRNGADIRAVQKMLGHSRLSITQIYTKVAGVDVKKTHREHHPREKDKESKNNKTRNKIKGYYNAKPD